MGSIERRISDLEDRAGKSASQWRIPTEVLVVLRESERHRARIAGEELPLYSEDELQHLYRGGLLDAADEGVLGEYRTAVGWQTPEAQRKLDGWQAGARRRLEVAEELGERWRDAYNCDLIEDDDGDWKEEGDYVTHLQQ